MTSTASSNLLRRRPVVVVMSVLAALQILTAGAALGDVIGAKAAALCVLVVAAAQSGIQFYVQAQVTPNGDVAAQVDAAGTDHAEMVAGPAAVQHDARLDEGVRVRVTPVDGRPSELEHGGDL
ncbi:hypothetical protein PZ938_10195 [Luteipulveratus sp. YIM 133132]|uniref:hypothetical protein n=1 Tax=Luteipulveratus flavus TaxID=3031728 RepID=UPI0023AEAAD7|nr:hypothetical protein [Luteipulveratus sp. YIM 133132]MDE9365973.1 hypothetical protein [Luteipulveratus sp. YIM 133132]